ncbi:hypothetical protein GGR57DRAFT_238454 [Xylariaceae sp. FL1272]|nr:hypothetical protein GGR57DRAFT_238454 [Xylariaceae sp. FL1272]
MNAFHNPNSINDAIRVALRGGSTPSPQPAKRQRRRRGKGKGKNKQVKLQKQQHEEVIGRLEEICDLLSLTLGEIVDFADRDFVDRDFVDRDFVDREFARSHASSYLGCSSDRGSIHGRSEGPHFGTTTTDRPLPPFPKKLYPWVDYGCKRCYPYSEAFPSPCSSCSPRVARPVTPVTEVGMGSTMSNSGQVENRANSFHLLQMDLEWTRQRLQDLQATVETAPVDDIRASVRQLADGLQESLDQGLRRLYTCNKGQQGESLTCPTHCQNSQATSATMTSGLSQQHPSHQAHKPQYVTPVRSVASRGSRGTTDSTTGMTPSTSYSTPCPNRSHSRLFTPDGREFADFDGWTWVDVRDCAAEGSKQEKGKGAEKPRGRRNRFDTRW